MGLALVAVSFSSPLPADCVFPLGVSSRARRLLSLSRRPLRFFCFCLIRLSFAFFFLVVVSLDDEFVEAFANPTAFKFEALETYCDKIVVPPPSERQVAAEQVRKQRSVFARPQPPAEED